MTRRVHSLRMRCGVCACVCISARRGPARATTTASQACTYLANAAAWPHTHTHTRACVYVYALAALNMLMYGGSDSIVRPIFHWRIDPAICAHIFAPTTLPLSFSHSFSFSLAACRALPFAGASLLRRRCTCKNHGRGGTTVVARGDRHRWILLDLPCYWVFGASFQWSLQGLNRLCSLPISCNRALESCTINP